MAYYQTAQISHVVACPVTFLLFYEQSWQGEVLKVMKTNQFLVFLSA